MPATKLKAFLDDNHVKYVTISHSQAYAAHEIAASAHIPAKEVAKVVMLKIDGKLTMAVLPASHRVDLEHLRESLGVPKAVLATEHEFKDTFPGCALGAMPPFGNLYGLDVLVAERLTQDKEIAFNAGTHTELIKLDYEDYERLVNPKILEFT
jgi:Ala-tRNA(Pro) deacylase